MTFIIQSYASGGINYAVYHIGPKRTLISTGRCFKTLEEAEEYCDEQLRLEEEQHETN